MNSLVIAFLAGIGGMFGWGIADFLAKKTIDKIGDVASLAWGHFFGTAALFVAFIFNLHNSGSTFDIPSSFLVWIGIMLFGVLQAIVYFYVYKGFGKGQVSLLSPVFASFSGITAVLSIIFFKESVSIHLIIGLIVIFLGIILVNSDNNTFSGKKVSFVKISGFKEVAIATILAGLWTLFWDRFIGQDWITYTFFMYLFMTITIYLISKRTRVSLKCPQGYLLLFLIFIGLGEVLAYLAVSWGYSMTSHTSVVALLSGAFSLPVIILSKIFLKESVARIQTVGSIVLIVGIILISIL